MVGSWKSRMFKKYFDRKFLLSFLYVLLLSSIYAFFLGYTTPGKSRINWFFAPIETIGMLILASIYIAFLVAFAGILRKEKVTRGFYAICALILVQLFSLIVFYSGYRSSFGNLYYLLILLFDILLPFIVFIDRNNCKKIKKLAFLLFLIGFLPYVIQIILFSNVISGNIPDDYLMFYLMYIVVQLLRSVYIFKILFFVGVYSIAKGDYKFHGLFVRDYVFGLCIVLIMYFVVYLLTYIYSPYILYAFQYIFTGFFLSTMALTILFKKPLVMVAFLANHIILFLFFMLGIIVLNSF